MFFGTRFFRSKKEDKVGTNNLVKGFEEILKDEENELLENEEPCFQEVKNQKSVLDTLEQISKRGIPMRGWNIVPTNNIDENTVTGIFIYRIPMLLNNNNDYDDDYLELNVGWYMDLTWPLQHERPFIEWLSVRCEDNSAMFVFGDTVKYCISEELLSLITESWKERENSLDTSFNNWFEDYRKRCKERGWIK